MRRKMLSGRDAWFFRAVILIETVTYTASFLLSGLAKKDIFNHLEGKKTTLGISSLSVLILLNTAIPLAINLVKQINAGLAAKAESRMRKKAKLELLSGVLNRRPGDGEGRKYGETVSLYRNECEDLVSCRMEYYRQLPRLTLCAAILAVMLGVNPLFAAISLIPALLILLLIRRRRQAEVAERRLKAVNDEIPQAETQKIGTLPQINEDAAFCPSGDLRISVDGLRGPIRLSVHPGEKVLISGGQEADRSRMLRRLFQVCAEHLPEVPAVYVPAEPVLFQTSIRDNICFGEPFFQERLDLVMELAGLKEDFEKEDRNEIERSAGKMGAALSGGQKKRIGIARALYTCMSRCASQNGAARYLLFIDGLTEAVDERTGEYLISHVLNRPDAIAFVASDSERLRGCAAQILPVQ